MHLTDSRLFAGDILQLSDNYDTGPGSGPVDLMVFDPRDDDAVFGLGADWLIANRDRRIVSTYHPKDRIPVEKALVLRKEGRSLPEEVR